MSEDITRSTYAKLIGDLPLEKRIYFYEIFAHNLTVSCRCIWSNEEISLQNKFDAMKWLNEILHRVTAKITVERTQSHKWPEDEFIDMVYGYVQQCHNIKDGVAFAISTSYKVVFQHDIPVTK